MCGKRADLGRWTCKACGLIFPSRKELFIHNKICEKRSHANNGGNYTIINEKCPFCGKLFTRKAPLTCHISVCEKNPNRDLERIKKYSEAQQKFWNSENGRKRKEAASKRSVFNNFWEYRSKNPIVYESKCGLVRLDSQWELLVAQRLDELNVEWYRPKCRLPYLDDNGIEHNYIPDFYVKTFNCFIEVKSKFIANWQNSINKVEYIKEHYKFVKWIETEDECSTFELQDLACDFVPERKDENIEYWLEKQKAKKEPKIQKPRVNIMLEKQRWDLLQNSNIDFSKFGWVGQVARLFGIPSENKAGAYVKKHYPEFYQTKCFKRKS